MPRIRLTAADDSINDTIFVTSLILRIRNNLTGEKVIGQLGNLRVNTGTFEVRAEAQAAFIYHCLEES